MSNGESAWPSIPTATYRVQFNRAFTFKRATQLVPYLHELGITDLYCSPYFTAVPGSMHGYDVVDPTSLNPELGSTEDYQELVGTLRRHAMGQLLDVVANHMGITRAINGWWRDVLENGPSSPYAAFFDIDWDPVKSELRDKVLLPILGDHYGVVLENQELQLAYERGRFTVRYYDHSLPVAPKSSMLILAHRLDALVSEAGATSPHVMELQSIITALRNLPSRQERRPELVEERYREKEIIRARLSALYEGSAVIRQHLDENVRLINGSVADPKSFDLLDQILNDQAYRLAYWRVAAEEINYRRFFDINELAAIRMENPLVFEETHALLFRLLREGAVTGLRIDHVDGLYDPADYLQKLQAWARAELPGAVPGSDRPLYVVVEKILGVSEELPANWSVYGTTGYEFLALVNTLFVDPANARAFDSIYAHAVKDGESFDELSYQCKQLIMESSMASELNVLGHQLDRLSERDRRCRDFTLNSLTQAIREIIACFPVYRTYITAEEHGVLDRDRVFIWQAVALAKRRNPTVSRLVFDFVRDLLLRSGDSSELDREERLRFVMKFQQTTSPVTAKGVEDTAFYRYHRFVSLNEVGSDPHLFGTAPALVHQQLKVRQERWPMALSTSSTHDTKRSEDVRARLNALSELPKQWKERVTRWRKLNRKWKTVVDEEPVPGPPEEYLLYQILVGVWPLASMSAEEYEQFVGRIQAYMIKAVKEAKQHTSWVSSNREYEEAVSRFVASILDRSEANPFVADFLPFHSRVGQYGLYNSLAQLVIKLAAPGVPDFYQGTELWDFSLVDPDNRRPVDFQARAAMLADLRKAAADQDGRPALVRALLDARADGRIKLFVTSEGLRFRRAHQELFRHGRYAPLEGTGERAAHVFAFARSHADRSVVAAVPRLLTQVIPDAQTPPLDEAVWGKTWIVLPHVGEGRRFRNVFSGATLSTVLTEGRPGLPVGQMFADLPVALLVEEA